MLAQAESYADSPYWKLITIVLAYVAGGMLVLLGYSTIKRRRLSNSRKLYLLTGVKEFQGNTAVIMGKIILGFGYFWLSGVTLVLIVLGLAQLMRSDRNNVAMARAIPQQQEQKSPSSSEHRSAAPAWSTSPPAGVAGLPSSPAPASPPSFSPPSNDSPPGGAAPGPPHTESTPPGSPPSESPPSRGSAFGGPSSNPGSPSQQFREFEERQKRQIEEFERRSREMQEQFRNRTNPRSSGQNPPAPRPTRKWTSADGKYTVIASLVEQTADEAILKKTDGSTVKVEKKKLCEEDQKYLAKHP